ncbi:hypothetical protein E2C01_072494 [Portunus trituberculatus]|uniref:Uncharacterized protein n=1 Tax=Portunus trituberculatus TaxID=210409 RepID=A0A5B7HY75_PORTR|nr:hypothetical protein [Portunus trituberculatus]
MVRVSMAGREALPGNLQRSVPFTRDNGTLQTVSEDAVLSAEQFLSQENCLGCGTFGCVGCGRGGKDRKCGERSAASSRRLDSAFPASFPVPKCLPLME